MLRLPVTTLSQWPMGPRSCSAWRNLSLKEHCREHQALLELSDSLCFVSAGFNAQEVLQLESVIQRKQDMLFCQYPVNTYHISLSFTPGVRFLHSSQPYMTTVSKLPLLVIMCRGFRLSWCLVFSPHAYPVQSDWRIKPIKNGQETWPKMFEFVTWFRLFLSVLLSFFLSVCPSFSFCCFVEFLCGS